MSVINLTAEPIGRLHSWIPHDLEAERIVFLPDACPGKSPLPTGTAVLTRQDNWRKFAVSDCGCGMRLLRSEMSPSDLNLARWDRVADILNSISHGTGRKMSRSDCKPLADAFDFATMRQRIMIPTGVEDCSLRTDGPFAYRDLDECLGLIKDYVEPVMRFSVIGYMGHL